MNITYDRMQAKPILGEHCHFCGDSDAPLVKTLCCDQLICCDTAFVSIHGADRCQYAHERFSLCFSHYSDGHQGSWKTCRVCEQFWSAAEYKEYFDYSIPRFEDKCIGDF